jgi:hypothetical protein
MSQAVANLFPLELVESILRENLIFNAQAQAGSTDMAKLMVYWKNYVEADLKSDCNMCFQRVLNNFKNLQPYFINMVKTGDLLDKS